MSPGDYNELQFCMSEDASPVSSRMLVHTESGEFDDETGYKSIPTQKEGGFFYMVEKAHKYGSFAFNLTGDGMLQVSHPPEAFMRLLEAVEFTLKLGLQLPSGSFSLSNDGKLHTELKLKDWQGQSISENFSERFQYVFNSWPFHKMGELFAKHGYPVPVVDAVSKYGVKTITVAGEDKLGILRDICQLVTEYNLDIVATTLHTQGLLHAQGPVRGRFASVFYVRQAERSRPTIVDLPGLEKDLKEKGLEVTIGGRVATPDIWLNWELSRHAPVGFEESERLCNAVVELTRHDLGQGCSLKFTSNDRHQVNSYQAILDTLCILFFKGCVVKGGRFTVTSDHSAGSKMSQEYELELPRDFSEEKLQDLRSHLLLSLLRRGTQGVRVVTGVADDKPGLLRDLATLFHDSWWSITHADVEITGTKAKTIIYAFRPSEQSLPIEELQGQIQKLQQSNRSSALSQLYCNTPGGYCNSPSAAGRQV